ncbi:hypothetical protein [Peribacillus butanolivorans]|uniref:hypothetical protein n=1 Tax=Peribacillus butanolivorans TaxID=421767 RepID=UPI0036D9C5CB
MPQQEPPVHLTPDYIDSHALQVHNYESFGRSIIEGALAKAKETGINRRQPCERNYH